jgi:hypothetical protein
VRPRSGCLKRRGLCDSAKPLTVWVAQAPTRSPATTLSDLTDCRHRTTTFSRAERLWATGLVLLQVQVRCGVDTVYVRCGADRTAVVSSGRTWQCSGGTRTRG